MVITNNILILVLLNLFTIGLKKISITIFLKFKLLPLNQENKKDQSIYAISVLLGIFLFCIFSNFVLLIPSLIFFISNSVNHIYEYINLITHLLKIIIIILSLIGLKDIFKIFKILGNQKLKQIKFSYDKNFLISLFLSTFLYLLFAPKSITSGIHYDTGLYHLPFINHLSKYTIEPGLVNLHFRYGFYGLSFFGQVPFQMFTQNSNFLTPSLNICYLAIYISYFLPYLKDLKINLIKKIIKMELIFLEKINSISILYFWLSIIFFTGGIFKSLSSYSLDLPLFICGSIGFHLLILYFSSKKKYSYLIPILWLTFFSPIVKLSGISFSLFFIFLLFLKSGYSMIFKCMNSSEKNILQPIYRSFKKWAIDTYNLKLFFNYKLSLVLVICTTLVFILTNLTITGYPLFPSKLFGSFHDFSIDADLLENLKTGHLSWHRLQNTTLNDSAQYWQINYLKTRNGLINIIMWFLPCILCLNMFVFIKQFNKAKIFQININYLLFALTTIIIICFFYLIPVVNYYPWIPHCLIFLMLLLFNRIIQITKMKINFFRFTFSILLTFILLNSVFSYSNSLIIKNIPNSFFREPLLKKIDHEEFYLEANNWISFESFKSSSYIKIASPIEGDQCWGIEPPCTPSKDFLK